MIHLNHWYLVYLEWFYRAGPYTPQWAVEHCPNYTLQTPTPQDTLIASRLQLPADWYTCFGDLPAEELEKHKAACTKRIRANKRKVQVEKSKQVYAEQLKASKQAADKMHGEGLAQKKVDAKDRLAAKQAELRARMGLEWVYSCDGM